MEAEKSKSVYILLMRSGTLFSRFISFMTKSPYSHASLSFDRSCQKMYSFCRRYQWLPYPGAFKTECIDRGVIKRSKNAPCILYRVDVDEETYYALKSKVEEMYSRREEYKYNVYGTILCYFGISRDRGKKYFCSQFVSEVLNDAKIIKAKKVPTLFKPSDFLDQPELTMCYKGDVKGLKKECNGHFEEYGWGDISSETVASEVSDV